MINNDAYGGLENQATWLVNLWINNDGALLKKVREVLTPNYSPIPGTKTIVCEEGSIEYFPFSLLLDATIHNALEPAMRLKIRDAERIKGVPYDIYKLGRELVKEGFDGDQTRKRFKAALREVNWELIVKYMQEEMELEKEYQRTHPHG